MSTSIFQQNGRRFARVMKRAEAGGRPAMVEPMEQRVMMSGDFAGIIAISSTQDQLLPAVQVTRPIARAAITDGTSNTIFF
jgi:hypothetical protein